VAEREFLFGAQAGPAGGLVEVDRQAVRLAGAVGGRLEAGDLDFTEIGEVGAEEGGEGVGLGGAVRDVVDHGKRKGPVYIGLKRGVFGDAFT